MRYALLAVLLLACSDSAGPDSHLIGEGTYTLDLAGCFSCPLNSTPGIVAQFADGPVIAKLEVSGVTDETLTAELTGMSHDLLRVVDSRTQEMDYLTNALDGDGGYLGTWDYGAGFLQLTVGLDGCHVFVSHPNMPEFGFGVGTCEVQ